MQALIVLYDKFDLYNIVYIDKLSNREVKLYIIDSGYYAKKYTHSYSEKKDNTKITEKQMCYKILNLGKVGQFSGQINRWQISFRFC